jgi:hypothetical protein
VRRLVWFVPNDWRPTELHRVRCQELRLDIEALVRDFRLQEFNRQYSDWDRRFSKWIEDEKLKRETAAVARVQGHRGAGPGGLGMAAKQHNPGLTGFESLKETV